ncbi:MAG TPA: zf-HC2 domain-containing protein [Bryobacteraceae bacterium]|nr:zf-HC2 domain-containing protein [Bryobacteraceae bacterium]
MDHQEANHGKVLERYLLGELDDKERGAFEEHYFSCPICAEDVVSAAKFLDNARRPLVQTIRETATAKPVQPIEASRPHPLRWWERLLAPLPKPALAGACLALAATLAWQMAPGGAQPEVTGSYFVTATRAIGGAPRRIQAAPGQKRLALLFNHTDTSVTQFMFSLENADGQVVQQFPGRAPQDTNDIQVMVPVAGLHAGSYTLRVQNATTHADVAALPFELSIP